MEKRILLAFLLSIAVMYGFRLLTAPKVSPTTPATTSAPAPASVPVPAAPPALPESRSAPAPGNDEIRAEQAEDVAIDTTLYTATLSNHGAVLKSFRLK